MRQQALKPSEVALAPLPRQVQALLVNGSFLDVLDHVAPSLTSLGFEIVTPDELLPLGPAEFMTKLASIEVVFGPGPHIRDAILHAPQLKVVSLASSGYESVDINAATERGIIVTNAPTEIGTESVADLTFCLMLDTARHVSQASAMLRAGHWRRPLGVTVWNKTLGIIGFGRIGRAVAARARGFDMTVLVLSHHADDPGTIDLGVRFVPLEDLLRESDFVSLHSRYSARTHALIGQEQFRLMKRSAILINTARAGLVDQTALLEALRDHRIAGAGLDVYDGEPSTDHPLLHHPNALVTPHIGNRTHEGVHSVAIQSIRNAMEVLLGRRSEFVVNPEVYDRGVRWD